MTAVPDTSKRAYKIWMESLPPKASVPAYREWVNQLMLDWIADLSIVEDGKDD